ncbi:MAG: phosphatidylserine decarboxylase [Opitutae bacterium]|nr:phosphatidylserine decarboxylase [Opitutae bacterium]
MSDEIRYAHRYDGCIRREKVYGQKWLNLIYGSPLGVLPLWVAIKRTWFSNWYGRKMSRPESKSKIPDFIREFDLDESEFAAPVNSFGSFNEFFSRKLKAEARPICDEPETLAFPADGRHLGFSNLALTSSIFVKGQRFDLPSLFQSEELAKPYENGSLVISRLCPVDYHRFHFPIDGQASPPKLINGFLYSVNPIALRKEIAIFWQNKRLLSFVETKSAGRVAQFLVGATCVGSVSFTANLPRTVGKGEEFGYFSFGGSSVLTLFEEGKVTLSSDLLEHSSKGIELYARMGDRMGTLNLK